MIILLSSKKKQIKNKTENQSKTMSKKDKLKLPGDMVRQSNAEHIVACVNTMHQLEQMGVYDPVKHIKDMQQEMGLARIAYDDKLKIVESANSYIEKLEAQLAEKDKQIAYLSSRIENLTSMPLPEPPKD